jgi:hypothetical protein
VVVDLTAQALRDPEAKEDTTKQQNREDLILNKALQMFNEQPAEAKKAA